MSRVSGPGRVRAITITVVCVAVVAVWMSSRGYQSTMNWPSDMRTAVQTSSAEGKPLVAAFHATWCPTCRQMEETTYRDSAVQRELGNFVRCRIDVDKDPASARAVGVSVLPLLIVFSTDGDILYRQAGYVSAPDLVRVLEDITRKSAAGSDTKSKGKAPAR